jgi:predicted metal-dependent hydrolase
LEYQLIRSSRRKTIALQVKSAQVIVRAPEFVKVEYIDNLIQLKSAWLKKKLALQQQQFSIDLAQNCPKNNVNPETLVCIDGIRHRVIICFGRQRVVQDEITKSVRVFIAPKYNCHKLGSAIIINKVKSLIELWFKASITDYLHDKLPILSERISLYPKAFKVRKYKARWGSCNSRGELSFNCLLKMLPPWVVDYVIVHELCHLRHMNHSTNFWQLVKKHDPDFHLAKNWLKKNQLSLIW